MLGSYLLSELVRGKATPTKYRVRHNVSRALASGPIPHYNFSFCSLN
jgi:hypothetical protein